MEAQRRPAKRTTANASAGAKRAKPSASKDEGATKTGAGGATNDDFELVEDTVDAARAQVWFGLVNLSGHTLFSGRTPFHVACVTVLVYGRHLINACIIE